MEQFGVSRQTVSRHASRAGVVRKPTALTDAVVREIVARYESGLGIDRIGEQMRIGPVRVRETLVAAGVEIRSCGGRTAYWVARRHADA